MKKLGISLSVVMAIALGIYAAVATQQEPEVITFIRSQGIDIIDSFNTPTELTGYAATYQGQPMSIYVTADNQHAVIGDLINAEGNDLGADAIYNLISKPQNERIWKQLEQASWVQDGETKAARIIYTFTDPFCPYCHRLRELADPYIQSGQVQFRHIIVGIIQDSSLEKAATILGSTAPEQALAQHRQHYNEGGIETDRQAASKGNNTVLVNNHMMEHLHLHATPTSFYRDNSGAIHVIEGLPRQADLSAMFEH